MPRSDSNRRVPDFLRVTSRIFENDAVVAFIDLLGTRKFSENMPIRDQAMAIMEGLLDQFQIVFSTHFPIQKFEDTFDVSIFADSVAICPRKRTTELVGAMVEFLLHYQGALLTECEHVQPSRAICTRGSFFALRLEQLAPESILRSRHTTVSLCGGRSVRFAHDCLEGLPIGVYVTDKICELLSAEQRTRIVPVGSKRTEEDNLSFIKRADGLVPLLPPATRRLLDANPDASSTAIIDSIQAHQESCPQDLYTQLEQAHCLRPSFADEVAFEKWASWVLVHLGKEYEVIRSDRTAMAPVAAGPRED